MATRAEQLKKELAKELEKEIAAVESNLAQLKAELKMMRGGASSNTVKAVKAPGTRKPRTEEQKAAQAERMKKMWAAKKAGKKSPAKKDAA